MNNAKRQNRIGSNVGRTHPVKSKGADKQMQIEGVHKNVTLTHCLTSLVGCVVTVRVKNGKIYEGVFRTFSPKVEIVLSAAHLVDEHGARGDSLPTSDTLVESIIFPLDLIISMTAAAVDLGFADQNGFTDAAISRYNGYNSEKDLKELQPWQSDADIEDMRLDDSSGTGWAAEDMFKRNEQNFNVKSVYNEDLEQYTTPLQKADTLEWQEREKKAEKIAAEIESSELSQRRYEAENEDSIDEEAKFSAVTRPGRHYGAALRATSVPIQFGTATSAISNAGGRYVPPYQRSTNQSQGKAYTHRGAMSDLPDVAKANGKPEDRKAPADASEAKQTKATSSSESVTLSPPTGKPDARVNPQLPNSSDKEAETQKLKKFQNDFKLVKSPTKHSPTAEEAETKVQSAVAVPSAATAPLAASTCATAPAGMASAVSSTAAASPTSNATDPPAPNESTEAGSQKETSDISDKQEKEPSKIISSLNPNAPVFQPRQSVPPSPQPSGFSGSQQHPRMAKKATVSYAKASSQHHQANLPSADQISPAHVQAATGQPFITANQYAAGYMNYAGYGPSPYPVLSMQSQMTPRANQDMGQGQHFAYGVPQGVIQSHMQYGGQGAQQMLQPNGMHMQPLPQQTPPPQLAQGGPGAVGPPNPQQMMQHGNGVATASQQPAAVGQGVLTQQQYGNGYQGQPAGMGHPPLQASPQSSSQSPMTAASVQYPSGAQYYHHPYGMGYGNVAPPPHGSMHQPVTQPFVFYPMPGQQHHQHHMQQHLFHQPMTGPMMMAPSATPGGSSMYMQQSMSGVPGHHQMQNYQQQQQQP